MRLRTTRTVGLAVVLAAVAACSPGGGDPPSDATPVSEATVDRSGTSSTAATAAPGGDDVHPTTAVRAPDPEALPELEDDPESVQGRLGNGLRYVLRDNDNPGGSVSMRLVIDAGGVHQEPDQVGVAHFLEHMLFNGTEQFPENELTEVLRGFGAAFGADVNAYTSSDETVYQLTMPDDDEVVDTGLDVLAQWLTAATIDPAQVEAEIGVVLDEYRQSRETVEGRVFAAVESFFLDGSPYEGQGAIGTADAIEAMSAELLRRFYDDWYRPDNAAIVVIGDIDVEEVEAGIIERFAAAKPRVGDAPDAVDRAVQPSNEPIVEVFADDEITTGFAFVTLPLASSSGSAEALAQRAVLDELVFDIIATRLSDDARRGDAPFRSAGVGSSSYVRTLDAPEIGLEVDGAGVEDSVTAVLDEYERVRRFGVTEAEVARAVATVRSASDADLAAAGSRQDASFADAHAADFLTGVPVTTAERRHEFVAAVLDAASTEVVAWAFVDRWDRSAPHVFVGLPSAEVSSAPSSERLRTIVDETASRPIEPRAPTSATIDGLMASPAPVDVVDRVDLVGDGGFESFRPELLVFDNGVRVVVNRSSVVEGYVEFEALSPGGLSLVAVDDLPDAVVAAGVVYESGVADIDPVAFEAFRADRELELYADIGVFTEGLSGYAAVKDLETLFQYIHLLMTDPRVDQIALDNVLADALPLAEDPTRDPDYAGYVELLDARYDDARFLEPSAAALATADVAGIERVVRDRFGDASDWVFSFSGDVDTEVLDDLARRYLGTLPATGRVDDVDVAEPPPPAGVVRRTVRAGQGDQATVTTLFTAPATTSRRDDTVALIVAEVIGNRLIDRLREELGDTYSPSVFLDLTVGPAPNAELLVTVSTSPELAESVARQVLVELDDFRRAGPSPAEFASAQAVVVERLGFFDNAQINREVLAHLVDPAGNPSLDDYLGEYLVAQDIEVDEVADALRRWTPPAQFIQVITLPA